MAWKVEVSDEFGFIQTVYSGKLTWQDKQDATAQTLALAHADRPNRFLTDIQAARLELSLFDLCEIPGEWDAAGAIRWNRLAIVASRSGTQWNDLTFFETYCRNRGWKVTVFSDRQGAIEWLTQDPPSHQLDARDDK